MQTSETTSPQYEVLGLSNYFYVVFGNYNIFWTQILFF